MTPSPPPAGPVGPVGLVGGRGKTGRAVGAALADRHIDVVPTGREEWSSLSTTLAGCDAVYLIAPNFHPDEPAYVAEVLDAAQSAGITRVVYHSVASPYVPAMPHHLAKAQAEDIVRRSGLGWTILQPCAYLDTLLPGLRAAEPAVRVPYDVDLPHGLVDLADVAACAASVLVEDGHIGASYELGGPLVTLREVAAAAAEVLGKPVDVERIDPDVWEREAGADLDEHVRVGLRAMFDYYDAHGFVAASRVAGLLLGRPPHGVTEVLRRELAQDAGQSTPPREE